MSYYYKLSVNTDLIQNLRLIQALSESDREIVINDNELHKFTLLPGNYALSSTIDISKVKILTCVVSHEKPSITIGTVTKNLIFSKKLFEECQKLWSNDRAGIFFSGFMTAKRKAVIEKWLTQNHSKNLIGTLKLGLFTLLQKIPFSVRVRYLKKIHVKIVKLSLVDSISGRTFPDKSFDIDYFSQMAKAKFVLCPNGDFVWTYRFFEAIMCGAIPVIEDSCDLYEGFKYYHFDDVESKLIWNENIVQHNYNKCLEMLTLSESELSKIFSQTDV